MPPTPTWRRIEAALIELFSAEGFRFEWDKGDTYVTYYRRRINLADFARQLEDRL